MTKNDTVFSIEQKIQASQIELLQANDVLSAAVTAYDASLEQGRDAAKTARTVKDDAEIDRDIIMRRLDKLDVALKEARAVADEARIEGLITTAQEAALSFETAMRRDLPKMGAMARKLVRLWADADNARKAAVLAGGDESALPYIEGFRALPGKPRQEIETRRVKRWVYPASGQLLSDEQSAYVFNKGTEAYLKNTSGSDLPVVEQEFDRIVYLEAEKGPNLISFLDALCIPGLMAGDRPGWSVPSFNNYTTVISHLDLLESPPPATGIDERERKVRFQRVEHPDNSDR